LPFWAGSPHLDLLSIFSGLRQRYFAEVGGEIGKLDVVGGGGSPLEDGLVELLQTESEIQSLVVWVLDFEQEDANELLDGEMLVGLYIVGHL